MTEGVRSLSVDSVDRAISCTLNLIGKNRWKNNFFFLVIKSFVTRELWRRPYTYVLHRKRTAVRKRHTHGQRSSRTRSYTATAVLGLLTGRSGILSVQSSEIRLRHEVYFADDDDGFDSKKKKIKKILNMKSREILSEFASTETHEPAAAAAAALLHNMTSCCYRRSVRISRFFLVVFVDFFLLAVRFTITPRMLWTLDLSDRHRPSGLSTTLEPANPSPRVRVRANTRTCFSIRKRKQTNPRHDICRTPLNRLQTINIIVSLFRILFSASPENSY